MKTIKIGNSYIGDDHPPFFVAELGICHGGSVTEALDLAKIAAETGVPCIKTEMFRSADIVIDPEATCNYRIHGKLITELLTEHMQRFELSFDEHAQVRDYCKKLGVPFMTTVHDFTAVDFMKDLKADALKISSPDVMNYPLLNYIAETGIPVFMDSGSTMQYELEIAVKELRNAGCQDLVVNHNPIGHPATAENHHLRVIPRLKEVLGTPIGISDHYEGYEMVAAAAVIGANVIEKPISKDRFVEEPERNYSISTPDLPEVLEQMHKAYNALGLVEKPLTKDQIAYRNMQRVSCVTKSNLKKGDILSLDNVIFGRPCRGIPAELWSQVEGKKLRHNKDKHEFINWIDLDE